MSHNEYLAFNFQNFDRDSFRLTGEKSVIRPVKGIPGEGCGRESQVGGTHMQLRVIHVDVWQKPPQYCKEIILQLK